MRKLVAAIVFSVFATAAAAQNDDPYLWLEDIHGAKPLAQVKAWNADAERVLTKVPGYEQRRKRALELLNDPRQIAMPGAVLGDMVTNHWVDADHKRGLWRVSPLEDYVAGKPRWRVLIDVDALGAREGESWVWHGADCLSPTYQRCLVSLSPGGSDADVVREFDVPSGTFVEGGFEVPLGKTTATWFDRDTLLVAAVEDDASATRSGYPRVVKMWKRGTPWSAATVVAEGTHEDIAVSPFAVSDKARRYVGINRGVGFYERQLSMFDDSGKLVALPLPPTARFDTVIDGQAIVSLIDPLGAFQPGTIVAFDLAAMLAGQARSRP